MEKVTLKFNLYPFFLGDDLEFYSYLKDIQYEFIYIIFSHYLYMLEIINIPYKQLKSQIQILNGPGKKISFRQKRLGNFIHSLDNIFKEISSFIQSLNIIRICFGFGPSISNLKQIFTINFPRKESSEFTINQTPRNAFCQKLETIKRRILIKLVQFENEDSYIFKLTKPNIFFALEINKSEIMDDNFFTFLDTKYSLFFVANKFERYKVTRKGKRKSLVQIDCVYESELNTNLQANDTSTRSFWLLQRKGIKT